MKAENQLKQVQQLGLEALTELRKFCQKNGMDFFLRGGSVMGAVKYHGFVPWDDDADIAVLRSDYEKLIRLTSNQEWSDKFDLISYKTNPEIHCYFPRVLLKESVREKMDLPRNNKLGLTLVDVLPIDGAPDTAVGRLFYFAFVYMYRALAGVCTLDVKETVDMHDSKKRFILKVLKATKINKLYTQVKIYDKLDVLYQRHQVEKARHIGTITGSLYRKEIMKKEWWGEGIEMSFENKTFKVPLQYDDYLKRLYGDDYMTYTPSISQQRLKKHIK